MDVELIEILDFLAELPPFDLLPPETLEQLPAKLTGRYVRRGDTIMTSGGKNHHLHIIRSGAVELRNRQGELLIRLGEGSTFGAQPLFWAGVVKNNALALEDCLLYDLPQDVFLALCQEYDDFSQFFVPLGASRLRNAVQRTDEPQMNLMTARLRDLPLVAPVTVDADTPVAKAARRMSEGRSSALLVMEGDKLTGILTDQDLRTRVVAAEKSFATPVKEVMTEKPLTLSGNSYLFDALLAMARHNILHLPILEGSTVLGILTSLALTQRQCASAVHLVGDIHRRNRVEELVESAAQVPQLLADLVSAGATAQSVGHIVSVVSDTITQRLIALAEAKLGPPPVPFAWMAGGSQARNERTARGDQDNGLILDDTFKETRDGPYFTDLAHFVCDALNACGQAYCPGDMMATNPLWRQPLSTWKDYFRKWIDTPDPKALMLSSVFFDLRCVAGEKALLRKLRNFVSKRARENWIFLAHMAANALSNEPPLGFFRNFVLVHDGEHDDTLNLKRHGIIPIVDLARVYALAGGVTEVNTHKRLIAAAKAKSVSHEGAQDLIDALDFIIMTRLRHQARLIRLGGTANNYLSPQELSSFERHHLKDAFAVVQTMQKALAQRFQTARFG